MMEQLAIEKHSDAATWKLPVREYTAWTMTAQYVPVSDGVKVATYLFLPEGLGPAAKIPAIIIPTPYFSMPKFRSPLFEALARRLAIAGQGKWAEDFTRFGYAAILWDLRGSGASYGMKRCNWVPDIARDTTPLVEWIISQPWSNGNVGATGISGPGMICQWMLTAKHPALKAIVPRFTTYDIYNATLIGGLTASRFIQDVGAMLRLMDANRLSEMPKQPFARFLLRFFGMQLMPMDEDRYAKMLAEAVHDHLGNEYLDQDLVRVAYNDDQLPSSSTPVSLETLSPYAYNQDMLESGAAIYGYGGWFDGAFPRDLISLHMSVRTPGSKLILGPWGHHAKFNSSPLAGEKQPSEFDQAAEIARFFD
jgi:putative CocE/NonD family hydrolase